MRRGLGRAVRPGRGGLHGIGLLNGADGVRHKLRLLLVAHGDAPAHDERGVVLDEHGALIQHALKGDDLHGAGVVLKCYIAHEGVVLRRARPRPGDNARHGDILPVGKAARPVLGGKIIHHRADGRCAYLLHGGAVLVHRVPREVKPRRLLLHRHAFARGELLYIRDGDGHGARLAPLVRVAEEVHLAGDVVARGLRDAVYDSAAYLHQRAALIAHRVERAGLYEIFHRAAVQLPAGHAAAEVLKAFEEAAALALRHEAVYRAPAYPLYRHKAVAQVFPRDGEVCARFVDVRRQELYAQLAALGDVLGDLVAVVQHARQQRRHVLLRVVALHVRGAVGDDGVAHGVRLVEGVACEVQYLVIYAVGHAFADAVCDRAGDAARRVAVDEGDALGVDDLVLLFGHGAAYHIRLPKREPGQTAEYFNDLLLIDDAAVGDGEYRAQKLMLIADLLRMDGAFQKTRYAVHGAGAVEGDKRGDVLDALRLQAHANARHARAFKLEHAARPPLGKHFISLAVVLGHILDAKARLVPLHELHRVVQHRQVPQREEVHFQKPKLLQRRHGVLAHDGLVVLGEGHVFIHGLFRDDDPGRVGGGVARHPLKGARDVYKALERLVLLVHLAQGF